MEVLMINFLYFLLVWCGMKMWIGFLIKKKKKIVLYFVNKYNEKKNYC